MMTITQDPWFQPGRECFLTRFRPEHAEAVSNWYYNFEYRYFFRDYGKFSDPEIFKTIDQVLARAGFVLLTILDNQTGDPIGLMTFAVEKKSASVYKFGIMLDSSCQRKTTAIEAIIIMGDYLFNKCSVRKLVVEFSDNDAQIHRICQIGRFTQEALLKEECFMDDRYWDEARYSFFNHQFDDLYDGYLESGLTIREWAAKKMAEKAAG